MTMHPVAAGTRRGHRGRLRSQLVPFNSPYAASAIALAREGAKVNALPELAVVFLPLIYEDGAPRLAVDDLFAPSKPFIPIDRASIARAGDFCKFWLSKGCISGWGRVVRPRPE